MPELNTFEDRERIIEDQTVDTNLNLIGDTEFALHHRVSHVVMCIATSGGSVVNFGEFVIEGKMVQDGGSWVRMQDTFTANSTNAFLNLVTVKLDKMAHGTSGLAIITTAGLYGIRFLSAQAMVTASPVTRRLEIGGQPLAAVWR